MLHNLSYKKNIVFIRIGTQELFDHCLSDMSWKPRMAMPEDPSCQLATSR